MESDSCNSHCLGFECGKGTRKLQYIALMIAIFLSDLQVVFGYGIHSTDYVVNMLAKQGVGRVEPFMGFLL